MSADVVEQASPMTSKGSPTLPPYALQYAPMLWLQKSEKYWPGNPLAHLGHCAPLRRDGSKVEVPKDLLGKCEQLKLPDVNQPEVFLHIDVSPKHEASVIVWR